MDLDFKLVWLLARGESMAEVIMTIKVLQVHSAAATKSICRNLNSLHNMFLRTDEAESISLGTSTLTCMHSSYGTQSPRTELAKLLSRPDYALELTEEEAAV